MSKRNRIEPASEPAADAAPADEEAVPAPEVRVIRLTDYLTTQRVENAADMRIKEAIYAAMERVCETTVDFVMEKQAEGFSLEEILALYEIVSPVVPTVEVYPDGRVRVKMDVEIVEKETA